MKRSSGILLPIVVGCGPGHVHPTHQNHTYTHEHGHAHAFTDAAAWSQVFDDPARDAWQHPDDIVAAMALTPTMTVADVGAGTGYFAMRLARAVPDGQVIATDIEPDMVKHLTDRARNAHVNNVRAVLATPASTGLAPASVDRILVVHVWHHLANHVDTARELAEALRPRGKLFIVEFSLTSERGPPASMRLSPEAIVAELTAAGFFAQLSTVAVDGQVIIEATRS
jgi:arsenite methyltransferase